MIIFQLVSLALLFLISALLPDSTFGQDVGQDWQFRQTRQAMADQEVFGQRVSVARSGKSLLNSFPFNAGQDHGHHGDHHHDHASHDHHEHVDDGR